MKKEELLLFMKKAELFGFNTVSELISQRIEKEDGGYDKRTALRMCRAASRFGSAFAEEMLEHPEHFRKDNSHESMAEAINKETKSLIGHDFKSSVQPIAMDVQLSKEESTAIAGQINKGTLYLLEHGNEDKAEALDQFDFLQKQKK